MEKFLVTIDGPSGVGKTSVGKSIATILNSYFFSSGSIYRSVAKFLLNNKKVQIEELKNKIKKINADYNFKNQSEDKGLLIKELIQIHEKLKQNMSISKNIDNIVVKKIKELKFIYLIAEDYPNKSLKTFIDEQKKQYNKNSVSLIISNNENKLSFKKI